MSMVDVLPNELVGKSTEDLVRMIGIEAQSYFSSTRYQTIIVDNILKIAAKLGNPNGYLPGEAVVFHDSTNSLDGKPCVFVASEQTGDGLQAIVRYGLDYFHCAFDELEKVADQMEGL